MERTIAECACLAMYATPSSHSLTPNAPSVRSNQGKTHAMHSSLSRPIWHCRGARNHDNDTGVVARGQHWSITRTHRVCKAEFPLLGPHCPVGEAKPWQNTRNTQVPRSYFPRVAR